MKKNLYDSGGSKAVTLPKHWLELLGIDSEVELGLDIKKMRIEITKAEVKNEQV